jgi:hypothetical protein
MADNEDAMLKALQQIQELLASNGQDQRKYFQQIADAMQSSGKYESGGAGNSSSNTQNLSGPDAFRAASERISRIHPSFDYSNQGLSPEEQRAKEGSRLRQLFGGYRYDTTRDVNDPERFDTENVGYLHREFGQLNVGQIRDQLMQGNLTNAGYAAASGLAKSSVARPFLIPAATRNAARAMDFARNRVMSIRLNQPRQMGQAAGYSGPGDQGFVSGLGSFASSMFAMPTLITGMDKAGGMMAPFGSMSPAAQAGYRMRADAFRSSLNPFDPLGYQGNLQLTSAAASKGYRTLGQAFSVKNTAKDLGLTVGSDDFGTMIDLLDTSIKKLGTDIKEASEYMENFGKMARGAGKGVDQFLSEVKGTLDDMTAQGARGQGALRAAANYSTIPLVSGQAAYGFLSGAQNPAMAAFNVANVGGAGGNINDIISIIGGNYGNIGGGGKAALDAQIAGINSMKQLVTPLLTKNPDGSNNFALAAGVLGVPARQIEQMYNAGDRLKGQAQFGKGMIELLGETEKERNAKMFSALQGEGGKKVRGAGAAWWKNISQPGGMTGTMNAVLSSSGFMRVQAGEGEDQQQFNIALGRLIRAKRGQGGESVEDVLAEYENDIDTGRLQEVANKMVGAGKMAAAGNTEKSNEYIRSLMKDYGGSFTYDQKGLDFSSGKTITAKDAEGSPELQKKMVKLASQAGLLDKAQEQNWMKKVNQGSFNAQNFEERMSSKFMDITSGETIQKISFSQETEEFLKQTLTPKVTQRD